MRKADIVPGQVYVKTHSRMYRSVSPDKAVFLTPLDSEHLFTRRGRSGVDGQRMIRSSKATRPQGRDAGLWDSSPSVGYLVATGLHPEKAELTEAVAYGYQRIWDEESGTYTRASRPEYSYEILVSLTCIVSLYDDYVAETKRIKEAEDAARTLRSQENDRQNAVWDEYRSQIDALGLTGSTEYVNERGHTSPPGGDAPSYLRMDSTAVKSLLEFLGDSFDSAGRPDFQ